MGTSAIGFQDEYRGFLLIVIPDGVGFRAEVSPATAEAEKAIHGFRLTRGNLMGKSLHEAAKLFFADTRRLIDRLMPPASSAPRQAC